MQLHAWTGRCWCCRGRPCRLLIARNTLRPPAVAKGAYVLADAPDGKPDVILMGTGSEVSLCVDAYEKLKAEGIKARVVSMPSWEIFEKQDQAYKDRCCRPMSQPGSRSKWRRPWAGNATSASRGRWSACIRFGASAPLKDLQKKFGFTHGCGRGGCEEGNRRDRSKSSGRRRFAAGWSG